MEWRRFLWLLSFPPLSLFLTCRNDQLLFDLAGADLNLVNIIAKWRDQMAPILAVLAAYTLLLTLPRCKDDDSSTHQRSRHSYPKRLDAKLLACSRQRGVVFCCIALAINCHWFSSGSFWPRFSQIWRIGTTTRERISRHQSKGAESGLSFPFSLSTAILRVLAPSCSLWLTYLKAW